MRAINPRLSVLGVLVTQFTHMADEKEALAAIRGGALPVFETVIRFSKAVPSATFQKVPLPGGPSLLCGQQGLHRAGERDLREVLRMEKRKFNVMDVLGEQLAGVADLNTSGPEQIEYIDIGLLDGDERNFYQLTDIDELADNIQMCGLQQPIRVRAGEGGRFTIVSGHRRRAALAQLVEKGLGQFRRVPCIRETDDASRRFRNFD